jgi:arsenate reductase
MKENGKIQVLFICTGNSARSQMAEGLLRRKAGNIADVYSGGTEPAEDVHPLAKEVMIENGIDPSGHRPKGLDQYLDKEFDIAVTMCDRARQSCPIFPGKSKILHWNLDDPAAVKGSKCERLAAFRKTFAELSDRVSELMKLLGRDHV